MNNKVREAVLERDKYCRMCGAGDSLHLHHIHYKSQGGKDTIDNLIVLCYRCHDKVHRNKKYWQNELLKKIKK